MIRTERGVVGVLSALLVLTAGRYVAIAFGAPRKRVAGVSLAIVSVMAVIGLLLMWRARRKAVADAPQSV
jgi:hypothetical protein